MIASPTNENTPVRQYLRGALAGLAARRFAPVRQHPPYVHRTCDVLDRLLAVVLVSERELVPYLFVHRARDANAAGVGETLQPRRDVDPVTVDLIALDHHVAEVDADAKLHPALRRQLRVLSLERGLNIDRAIHRLDHAGELGQNAIAGGVYEAAVVLLDQAVDDLAMSGQSSEASPPHLPP